MSLNDKILKRLKRAERDQVFTRSDFLDLGSTDAIGMAIQRLLKEGKLRRVARGLYDLPRTHPLLGELSATSDAIAAAIARRDGIRLQTTEAAAANLLNLSEQVPARIVYDSDQRRRTVKVGQPPSSFDNVRHARWRQQGRQWAGDGWAPRGGTAACDTGTAGAFAKDIETSGPSPVAPRLAVCPCMDASSSAVYCWRGEADMNRVANMSVTDLCPKLGAI